MFKIKYNTTLLDSKWSVIKNNVIFNVIPRKDEYIYFIDRYYQVLSIVHNIGKRHGVLIIVEEVFNQQDIKLVENQQDKK